MSFNKKLIKTLYTYINLKISFALGTKIKDFMIIYFTKKLRLIEVNKGAEENNLF